MSAHHYQWTLPIIFKILSTCAELNATNSLYSYELPFPLSPLTIESARLCDDKIRNKLKNSRTCQNDPTCRSCARHVDRFQALTSAYYSDKASKIRKDLLSKYFSIDKIIVVMALNVGMFHIFMNWVCSCEHVGINPRIFSLIVVTDAVAAYAAEKEGFVVDPSWSSSSKAYHIRESYDGRANRGPHTYINHICLVAVNALIQLGYSVLYQDVDIAWLADPRPMLRSVTENMDLVGMHDTRNDGKGPLNTGFVYIRATHGSKIFMQTLENINPVKGDSDQMIWNQLLKHHRFQQYNWRVLAHRWVARLRRSNCIQDNPNLFVTHTVGPDKEEKLYKCKLWFVKIENDVCQCGNPGKNITLITSGRCSSTKTVPSL